MDDLTQIRGVLRGIRSVTQEGIYTDAYSGMEDRLASTYRKCIDALKAIPEYENVHMIIPELADQATMQEIACAVEIALSLIKELSGPSEGFPVPMPFPVREPRIMRRGGPPGTRRDVVIRMKRRRAGGSGDNLDDMGRTMEEEIEREQERWESQIDRLEQELERIQDKIEATQERMQERLEAIYERYENKKEELLEKMEDLREKMEDLEPET